MSKSYNPAPFVAICKSLILSLCCIFSVSAWAPQPKSTTFHSPVAISTFDKTSPESENVRINDSRRGFLRSAAINLCLLGAAAPAVIAADATYPPGTRYISGKTPIAPGETKKKSDSTKGTRKDPDFLRSVADCRNQCQGAPGSAGLARSKEDCLSECQDICCKTYEQCTFNIVPRI